MIEFEYDFPRAPLETKQDFEKWTLIEDGLPGRVIVQKYPDITKSAGHDGGMQIDLPNPEPVDMYWVIRHAGALPDQTLRRGDTVLLSAYAENTGSYPRPQDRTIFVTDARNVFMAFRP